MFFRLERRASRDFEKLQAAVQRQAKKQFDILCSDIRHPSLHAKKYNEASSIWQARVNNDFRFYFLIHKDTYSILTITKHPK